MGLPYPPQLPLPEETAPMNYTAIIWPCLVSG